jgi:hypothetical protein
MKKGGELDRSSQLPVGARLAACVWLLLWIGIAFVGRGIGYREPVRYAGSAVYSLYRADELVL